MNFMMNPKTVLTVIAVLNALHGILWIFFLPLPEMGEEAVLIGTTYGKIVGCLNLVIFSILNCTFVTDILINFLNSN